MQLKGDKLFHDTKSLPHYLTQNSLTPSIFYFFTFTFSSQEASIEITTLYQDLVSLFYSGFTIHIIPVRIIVVQVIRGGRSSNLRRTTELSTCLTPQTLRMSVTSINTQCSWQLQNIVTVHRTSHSAHKVSFCHRILVIKPIFPNSALPQILFKAGECLLYVLALLLTEARLNCTEEQLYSKTDIKNQLKNRAKATLTDRAPQVNPARTTLPSRQLTDRHKAEAEITPRQWLEGRNEVKKRHSVLVMWVAGSSAQSHFLTPPRCVLPSWPAPPARQAPKVHRRAQIPQFLQQNRSPSRAPLLSGLGKNKSHLAGSPC